MYPDPQGCEGGVTQQTPILTIHTPYNDTVLTQSGYFKIGKLGKDVTME